VLPEAVTRRGPEQTQASYLYGVSCTSATACTAVGYYTNSGGTDVTLAEGWNGTSWAIQVTPSSRMWGSRQDAECVNDDVKLTHDVLHEESDRQAFGIDRLVRQKSPPLYPPRAV
jgi:hypothetical protein